MTLCLLRAAIHGLSGQHRAGLELRNWRRARLLWPHPVIGCIGLFCADAMPLVLQTVRWSMSHSVLRDAALKQRDNVVAKRLLPSLRTDRASTAMRSAQQRSMWAARWTLCCWRAVSSSSACTRCVYAMLSDFRRDLRVKHICT